MKLCLCSSTSIYPIDEARHYKKAQDDYDLSTRKLAEKYGQSHMYYDRKLKLLKLPKEIISNLVTPGLQLTETHCRHICKLLNNDKLQKKFEELYNIEKKEWDKSQVNGTERINR